MREYDHQAIPCSAWVQSPASATLESSETHCSPSSVRKQEMDLHAVSEQSQMST